MTSLDLLAQEETLFHELRGLARDEQERRLGPVGARDIALRGVVEALLQAAGATDSRLDRPIRDVVLGDEPAAPILQPTDQGDAIRDVTARKRPSERYSDFVEIGRGGMGTVYRVHDATLGRALAMKVLGDLNASPAPPNATLRFLREARVLARLDHSGIVPIHDFGVDAEGHPFFTMKLVRGRSLKDWISDLNRDVGDARRCLPVRMQVEVALRVCRTVAAAHRRGVIHRDLKPANVMLASVDEVYLMDWGIAKLIGLADGEADAADWSGVDAGDASPDAATLAGTSIGSPPYMSPEQADGRVREFDRRTDVFGLGGLLYHLATGNPPMWGVAPQILERAREAQLNDPEARSAIRRTPIEVMAICRHAMRKSPAERYPNVDAMIADLQAFLDDRPGTAWRDPVSLRAAKLVRRHPRAATAIAAGALVTLAGSLALMQVARSEARAAEVVSRSRLLEEERTARDLAKEIENIDHVESRGSYGIRTGGRNLHVTPEHVAERDLVRQAAQFSASSRAYVRLLDAKSISLSADRPAEEYVRRLAAMDSGLRPLIARALYRLAKHLAIAGVAQAAIHRRDGNAPPDESNQWKEMADRHADLVDVWLRIPTALSAFGDQSTGLAALGALDRWLGRKEDVLGSLDTAISTASEDELDFLSYVAQRMRKAAATVPFLESVLRRHPSSFWLHQRCATVAFLESATAPPEERRRDLNRVVAHATAAIALWPEAYSARNLAGLALTDLDDRDAALDVFRSLVERAPGYVPAWVNIANMALADGRLEEAVRAIDEAFALDESDADVILMRGIVYDSHAVKSLADASAAVAIASFRRYTQLRPDDWEGHLRLGSARMLQAEFADAIASFDAGLKLHPHGTDLRRFKAEAEWMLGHKTEAVDLLLSVFREFPDLDEGVELLERFVGETPDAAERERMLARMREARGR